MSHVFINHHFFYGHGTYDTALKGVEPYHFEKQLQELCKRISPAFQFSDGIKTQQDCFSITIDDGSKTVLDVVEYLEKRKINTYVCICGNSTLRKSVLSAHKINLLRNEVGDKHLYDKLKAWFTNVNIEDLSLKGKVKQEHLYRYDKEDTRKLKIALNYKLDSNNVKNFVDDNFANLLGSEQEWANKLYMSKDDLCSLPKNFEIVYHGTDHNLWSDLDDTQLEYELTPPAELDFLFQQRYFLSIPFGMPGSWNNLKLLARSKHVKGAFTMNRSLKHEYNIEKDFWWIHRYDQIDLFNKKINLTIDNILL